MSTTNTEAARLLRNRMRWLFEMGDAGIPHNSWKDTDEYLLAEYGQYMDPSVDEHTPWPKNCRRPGVPKGRPVPLSEVKPVVTEFRPR